jgi:hypothetical protein
MATTIGIVKSATETILGIGEVSIDNFTFKAGAGAMVANLYPPRKRPDKKQLLNLVLTISTCCTEKVRMSLKKEWIRVPSITPRTSVSIRMEKYCVVSNCL